MSHVVEDRRLLRLLVQLDVLDRDRDLLRELGEERQVTLAEGALSGRADSEGARDLADQQQDILAGLEHVTDRVMQLGEKTMLVSPELARQLGR